MATLSKSDLNRIVGEKYKTADFTRSIRKAATDESSLSMEYDIFLSHSSLDRDTIFQLNYLLEELLGLRVFVDWIEKPELDRTNVTPENAAIVRGVMNRSAALLYAISENSASSTWMPWELGYSDAKHGKVAILPISLSPATAIAYSSQQFVGLYPYVDLTNVNGATRMWVNDRKNSKRYAQLSDWKSTGRLTIHS